MSSVCAVTSSLYSSGQTIISSPIEASSIFLVVVLICACMEYMFSLAQEIKSKFFQRMFETISEEILVVGVLSLLLSFCASLPNSIPESWCIMIQWTHVCLLFMGSFFTLSLVLMVVVTFSRNSSFRKFEMTRINTNALELSGREARYKVAYSHFRLCCVAYRIGEDQDCVAFADYLLKTEKEQLVVLGDLTWRSWLGLTVLIVVNACRTRVPALVTALAPYRDQVDIASYIVLLGMVPMGVLIYLSNLLDQRFDQFLEKRGVSSSTPEEGRELTQQLLDDPLSSDATAAPRLQPSDLEDPRSFLLWQTPQSTMAILQIIYLATVWYGAVFCLNMLYITFTLDSVYQSLILIVGAVVPLIVVTLMLPRTLFVVAQLSSLGSCFNEARVRAMVMVAKGDVVATDAVTAEQLKQHGLTNREGAVVNRDAQGPKIVAVKKPPPPLIIDDQSLYRLAQGTEREML